MAEIWLFFGEAPYHKRFGFKVISAGNGVECAKFLQYKFGVFPIKAVPLHDDREREAVFWGAVRIGKLVRQNALANKR